jgi:hypothetical protein
MRKEKAREVNAIWGMRRSSSSAGAMVLQQLKFEVAELRKIPDAKTPPPIQALSLLAWLTGPVPARPERFAEQPTRIWSFLPSPPSPLLTTGHHQPTRQNGMSNNMVAMDATVH